MRGLLLNQSASSMVYLSRKHQPHVSFFSFLSVAQHSLAFLFSQNFKSNPLLHFFEPREKKYMCLNPTFDDAICYLLNYLAKQKLSKRKNKQILLSLPATRLSFPAKPTKQKENFSNNPHLDSQNTLLLPLLMINGKIVILPSWR